MSPYQFAGSGVKLSKNRRMYCPLLQKPQFLIIFPFIWLALTSHDHPLVMLNDGEEDAERAAGANDAVGLLSPEIVETVVLPEPIAIARLFLAALAAGFVPGLFASGFDQLESGQ